MPQFFTYLFYLFFLICTHYSERLECSRRRMTKNPFRLRNRKIFAKLFPLFSGELCQQNYHENCSAHTLTSYSCYMNRNQIVSTIFQLIWNQTKYHLFPNQSGNCNYILTSVYLTRIESRCIDVHVKWLLLLLRSNNNKF